MSDTIKKDLSYLKISDPVFDVFYNREINESFERIFPLGEYRSERGIVGDLTVLTATVDHPDNRIKDIDLYKYKDETFGAGRPVTDELKVTAADKAHIRDLLSTCTLERAPGIYTSIMDNAIRNGLPDGWKIAKSSSSKVSFQKDNVLIGIPLSKILYALELSFTYIEILTSADFWDANSTVLKCTYKEPLLALFSLVDTSNYYDRECLLQEAHKRNYWMMLKYGYHHLSLAIEQNETEMIDRYIEYAGGHDPKIISPLFLAIQQGYSDLVQRLLDHHASVDEQFQIDDEWLTPLCAAVENENDVLFSLCLSYSSKISAQNPALRLVKKKKRIDYLLPLLDKGIELSTDDDILAMSTNDLCKLAKYRNIIWTIPVLEKLYDNGQINDIKEILNNCQDDSKPYKVGKTMQEYHLHHQRIGAQCRNVSFIIMKQDWELLQYCLGLKYNLEYLSKDAVEKIRLLDSSWADCVQLLFINERRYYAEIERKSV